MKFGLSLCPEVGRYPETREQARAAEALGYDSVWLPEHHLMAGYAPSPMLGLAAVATVTERVQIGTDVAIVPFYNPVRLAEDSAMLSDMSDGRFILGVGLGYRKEEFAAFGVPFHERGRRMHESLAIIRRLLSEDSVSFSGEFTTLDEVTIYPRPPHVPLYVGGWSAPALGRAAEFGDAWFPGPTADLEKLKACLDIYDEALAEDDRVRTELPIFREVWVATDDGSMAAGVDPMRSLYVDDYLAWEHDNVDDGGTDDPFKGLSQDRFIVGDPEEVTEEICRYRDELGVTHLVARMHFHGSDHRRVMEAMELFSDRVMPAVRNEGAS